MISNDVKLSAVSPSSSPPNTASWQSVFWGVAAVALTTVTQNSGSACGINKTFTPLVRSSPVFCLVDSLVMIIQFIRYSTEHWMIIRAPRRSLRRALRILSIHRGQHSDTEDEANRAMSSQWITRVILLLLAITQLIKIFALRGSPLSQITTACYLISYITNGLINAFGTPSTLLGSEEACLPDQSKIIPGKIINQWIVYSAYAGQAIMWTFAIRPALPSFLAELGDESDLNWYTTLHCLLFLILALPVFLWLGLLYISLVLDSASLAVPALVLEALFSSKRAQAYFSERQQQLTKIYLSCGAAIARICKRYWLTTHLYRLAISKTIGKAVYGFLLTLDPCLTTFTIILLTAALSYGTLRIIRLALMRLGVETDQRSITSRMGWTFLFLFKANIVSALLYYSQVYDPSDTYKPAWVDKLGR